MVGLNFEVMEIVLKVTDDISEFEVHGSRKDVIYGLVRFFADTESAQARQLIERALQIVDIYKDTPEGKEFVKYVNESKTVKHDKDEDID